MATRHNHNKAMFVDFHAIQRFHEWSNPDVGDARKSLTISERMTIINDDRTKTQHLPYFAQRLSNMTSANNHKRLLPRLNINKNTRPVLPTSNCVLDHFALWRDRK